MKLFSSGLIANVTFPVALMIYESLETFGTFSESLTIYLKYFSSARLKNPSTYLSCINS